MYDRRMIDYIPHIIRDVREYKAIMNDAEQPEMVEIWNAFDNALNDQFILDATENGVSRWEKILGIIPKATLTLDERKFTILTRINEQLPFTITTLNEQLKSLCGADGYVVQLNANAYTLIVKVALVAVQNFTDVQQLLNRIVPANLIVQLSIIYNTHEVLRDFTHAGLSAYTHYQLRNEVLTNGN